MNPQQESNLPPGLSRPARRALTNAGYRRLEQLARVGEAEVETTAWDRRRLTQLRHALGANGLSFADGKSTDRLGTLE